MKTFPAILFIITFNSLFRDTDEAPWRRWRPVFRGFDDGPELYVPMGGKKWSTWEKPAIATATLFAIDVDDETKKLIRDVYSSSFRKAGNMLAQGFIIIVLIVKYGG